MKTVNFRDGVLYPIAYKIGFDPLKDFQSNQMIAIAAFINLAVARFWDKADFPEWTTIEMRSPINHVLPYDVDGSNFLWRVFKVFLLDPTTTLAPIETPFRLLDVGVHCGFDHGTNVWIKYLPPPPRYSGALWNSNTIYNAGDVVYLAQTGECYASIGNNNIGNNPLPVGRRTGISTQIIQPAQYDNPGLNAIPEIMQIHFTGLSIPPDPPPTPAAGSIFNIGISDGINVLGSSFHTATGSETLGAIITAMATALQASLPGGFTVTADTVNFLINIQGNQFFTTKSNTGYAWYEQFAPFIYHPLRVVITQFWVPSIAVVTGQPQIAITTLTPSQAIAGQVYELTMIDTAGVSHVVSYTAKVGDNNLQILGGLMAAISASADTFFSPIVAQLDTNAGTMTLQSPVTSSVDVSMRQVPPALPLPIPPVPQPPTFWTYVPFPLRLMLQVVDEAYAHYLRNQGENDKGLAEEKVAIELQGESVASIVAPTYDALTDQEKRAG